VSVSQTAVLPATKSSPVHRFFVDILSDHSDAAGPRHPAVVPFVRFKRSKVDLPQPHGPIMKDRLLFAVTDVDRFFPVSKPKTDPLASDL